MATSRSPVISNVGSASSSPANGSWAPWVSTTGASARFPNRAATRSAVRGTGAASTTSSPARSASESTSWPWPPWWSAVAVTSSWTSPHGWAGFSPRGVTRPRATRTVAVNVSTATVRVALGRVTPRGEKPAQPCGLVHDDVTATADHHGGHGQDVDSDAERAGELVVLAAPVPRTADRVAARFGELVEAPVVLTQGAHLPLVGLLLGLPTLEMTGLLEVATETFGSMSKGFYGLRATLLTGVFLALLREPRAEGAIRVAPSDLGRVLGLLRAPEVKTLRRKLAELAAAGAGAQLQAALGAHHAATRPDATGFLYLDGHVRVYTGTRELPKTHIARMRIAGPATEETWVTDTDGDPVMVITAPPSASLAAELARLLPDLRTIIGPDRACTVVFDRGGYSPAVFTEIITAGFDLLTYYKGTWTRSAPAAFTFHDFTTPDGATVRYELAERLIDLAVPARTATATTSARPGSTLTLRLIVRASPSGHQTPILTNRTDLTAPQVAYRMANRWRQENYFTCAREHFALDALDSYADHPDDLDRLVPNPAKAHAHDQVAAARTQLAAAHSDLAAAIDDAAPRARHPGSGGTATVEAAPSRALTAATADLAAAKDTSRATPSHLPLSEVRPGSRLLETERKLLTHAIRMSAYNTEAALARLLRPHYPRGRDEGRGGSAGAGAGPGDLQITGTTLHVRIDPASAPRRSRALAALAAELTTTATRYPGTNLTIAYSVKGHDVA